MRMQTARWMGLVVFVALVAQPPKAQGQGPPSSLVDVGENGENIYDLTKAKDWAKVGEKMKALETAAKHLAGVDPMSAEPEHDHT